MTAHRFGRRWKEAMTDLRLGEREQAAVRAIIASEPLPGGDLPGRSVLPHLARFIECDAIGVALRDGTGSTVGEAAVGRHRAAEVDLTRGDPVRLGVQHWSRGHPLDGSASGRGESVLSLGVRNGPDHVVTLWLVRHARDFTERDLALLTLVAPALERLLREPATSGPSPSITVQERRVLQHVAAGLSNAQIGERLCVAPATVRKHLEHAYRKLGVTNRLAAVNALDGPRALGPDAPGRVGRPA
jgi:DNA-binding CsgD family transcriptional regulator